MHRDKKIGLALGVLLVGIVGAFFFRHEPAPLAEAPQLEHPERLDAQIAEQAVTPYLTGIEAEPGAETRVSAETSSFAAVDESVLDVPLDDGAFGPPVADSRPAPLPIPMPPAGSSPALPASSLLDQNRAWDVVASDARRQAAGDAGVVVHQIQRGDTLSGLAFQYLGSSARFQEIYEANRDLLKSPDDLRVGMTLRIPVAASRKQASAPSRRPAAGGPPNGERTRNISIERELEVFPSDGALPPPPAPGGVAPRPSRLFQPVKRSPFLPRGDEQTGLKIPSEPVRVLSQAPPLDETNR